MGEDWRPNASRLAAGLVLAIPTGSFLAFSIGTRCHPVPCSPPPWLVIGATLVGLGGVALSLWGVVGLLSRSSGASDAER